MNSASAASSSSDISNAASANAVSPETTAANSQPKAPAELPAIVAKLRLERGTSLAPPAKGWGLDSLAGRLVELSSVRDTAALTAAAGLILLAQQRGEPAAWIAVGPSTFYPPDLSASGIDLAALPVVLTKDPTTGGKAADTLLRSGAYALVVLDLGRQHQLTPSAQARLAGLAKKHGSAMLFLTRKSRSTPSLGSLITLRGESIARRVAFDRFQWQLDILKDKQRGPGWTHAEICHAPDGL